MKKENKKGKKKYNKAIKGSEVAGELTEGLGANEEEGISIAEKQKEAQIDHLKEIRDKIKSLQSDRDGQFNSGESGNKEELLMKYKEST